MITYNSPKYNNLNKKILEILEFNNIDTLDAETVIPVSVLETIALVVQECLISADKFLTEKCPKCGKTHRLICENCGSTHAVLPDFCVPLKRYSKDAIAEIANMAAKDGTENTAATLNIEAKQIRRFVNVVKSFLGNVSVLAHKLKITLEFIQYQLKELYELLKQIPNITEKYFEEFRSIFLYEKNRRNLYIEYSKLSI